VVAAVAGVKTAPHLNRVMVALVEVVPAALWAPTAHQEPTVRVAVEGEPVPEAPEAPAVMAS